MRPVSTRLAAVLPALIGLFLLGGCTAGGTSYPESTTITASPARTAITTAINDINETAGGPVAAQRAVLDRLVAPDQDDKQQACPTATTTLAFDPAYAGLRTVDNASEEAAANDSEYLLPTYITIYTGGRITGSDLATLHVWVIDGIAHTSALCVS